MKKFIAVTALALACALPRTVMADPITVSFTFNGADGTLATGILTGTDVGGGMLDLTSGTIDVVTAGADTLVTGTGDLTSAGVDGSDDTLSLVSPYTSFGGISFAFVVDNEFVNLYSGDGGYPNGLEVGPLDGPYIGLAEGTNADGYSDVGGTLDVTTPEPSSLFLLGTGILGLGVAIRKARETIAPLA